MTYTPFDQITTVPDLARYLGNMNEKTLRAWLRKKYPNQAPGKGKQWELTLVMCREMRQQYNESGM